MGILGTPDANFWIFNHFVPPGEKCDSLPFDPNARSSWYANAYRSRMKAGDIAYIWMTNPEAQGGLYGYGTLAGKPYPLGNEDAFGVDVDLVQPFSPHIPMERIKRDRKLKDLLICNAPKATNFLLSPDQGMALMKFIRSNKKR